MSMYGTSLSLLLAQLWVLGATWSAETSDGKVFRHDYTFSQEATGWFKVHRESMEWETARIKCYNEGAVLASPVNANMATAMKKLLIQAELHNIVFLSGVSSPLRDGVFTSIEGIALDQLYGQWDIGQPNNLDGHQDCITYKHYKYGDILNINDIPCIQKCPFICYRRASSSKMLIKYRTVDKGVALDQLYTKWNIGQPNRGIRQDCTTFSYYNDRDIMPINDEDCYKKFPYICYRPAFVSDNKTKCATVGKVSETSDGKEFRSDYKFSQEAAGWLKLHLVPLDWETAKLQCYYEGAVIASPLNANLSTAMTMLLSQAKLRNSTEFFSGVFSERGDGVFTSLEGVALDQLYTQWDIGQPNDNGGNQHCITYFYYKDRNMLPINDENCNKKFPYICYRPASASDKLTECGTVDTEYKLDARTRHCYKFHRHGMEWPSAARACQAEGGYLAIIDSQPEADLLVELFAAYPNDTLLYTPLHGYNCASIGFSKQGSMWWTVQGKLLEESAYYNWKNKGEPNIAAWNQDCGGILRNGRLDYLYCDKAYAFICEKSPDSLLTTTGNLDNKVY